MEDNHAINEQPNSAVNYENEYNKLLTEYKKLGDIANKLHVRVQQLESTWMLQRASFLFKILNSDAFSESDKQEARKGIMEFLFPKQEEQPNDKEI